jgi:hypothetical protein
MADTCLRCGGESVGLLCEGCSSTPIKAKGKAKAPEKESLQVQPLEQAPEVVIEDVAEVAIEEAPEITVEEVAEVNSQPIVKPIREPKPAKLKVPREPKPEKVKVPREPKPAKVKVPREPKPAKVKVPRAPREKKEISQKTKKYLVVGSLISALVVTGGVFYPQIQDKFFSENVVPTPLPTATATVETPSPAPSPSASEITPSAKPSSTASGAATATEPAITATPSAKATNSQSSAPNGVSQAMRNAINLSLKQCAASTKLSPVGCPFSEEVRTSASSITWKLVGTPKVTFLSVKGNVTTVSVSGVVTGALRYGNIKRPVRNYEYQAKAIATVNGSQVKITWK